MKKSELKAKLLESITQSGEAVGLKYGVIKSIQIQNEGDSGFIGLFYKQCKDFETYKGQDTRPVEIFSYEFEYDYEEDETGEEIETCQIWIQPHYDCNGKDEEWIEKKSEKESDKDFFEYWIQGAEMTIYTIVIINQRHGWVAHIETHSNAQQAEKRLDYHEQKWNKDSKYDYLVEMHTTDLGSRNEI